MAILCSYYKIFSKVLANRLNGVMHGIVHKDQSYCIKYRCISDNLHSVRDVIDSAVINGTNVVFLSLDQEKAFDRVDQGNKSFWFWGQFYFYSKNVIY